MSLLAAAGLLLGAVWIVLAAAPPLRWPRELVLPGGNGKSCAGAARGAIIALVPARDEAAMLPLTLPALLGQEGLEAVVLVDDASSDDTGALARELAAAVAGEPARLEVLRLDEDPDRHPEDSNARSLGRPSGWNGKVAAQARGFERARERFGDFEWLLLVDADVRLRPGTLPALLEVARSQQRDLVSVMARLRAVSFWERLLVPPFVYFFQLLYPFRLVRRDDSRVAAAAGGCVLVRVDALERAGGFATIRDRLIDDVALASAVKRSGGRLWLGFDDGVESVRAYRSLREMWRMISRNAFVQLGFRWSLLAATLAGLAVVFVSPPLGLALSLALSIGAGGAIGGGSGGPAGAASVAGTMDAGSPAAGTTAAGTTATGITATGITATGITAIALAAIGFAVAWLLQAVVLWPSVRHHRAGFVFAWTLPFAAALYAAMTASSAWSYLRGSTSRWRGREYRRDDRRARPPAPKPSRRPGP
jgi:hopene-associated glycosyltransferase HpnB